MLGSWWSYWALLMFVILVPPLGYGWGYRGWGPPYPRYIQRRRGQRAVARVGTAQFNHLAWGWGGDIVWLIVLFGCFTAFTGMWWHGEQNMQNLPLLVPLRQPPTPH